MNRYGQCQNFILLNGWDLGEGTWLIFKLRGSARISSRQVTACPPAVSKSWRTSQVIGVYPVQEKAIMAIFISKPQ